MFIVRPSGYPEDAAPCGFCDRVFSSRESWIKHRVRGPSNHPLFQQGGIICLDPETMLWAGGSTGYRKDRYGIWWWLSPSLRRNGSGYSYV